jgi:hypothetical protein
LYDLPMCGRQGDSHEKAQISGLAWSYFVLGTAERPSGDNCPVSLGSPARHVFRKNASHPAFATKLLFLLQNIPLLLICSKNGSSIK